MTSQNRRGIKGRRFQPGQSGNPGGRPKQAKEFAEWLRTQKFSRLDERERLWKRARKSDYLMAKLLEYAFGKPPQPVTGEGGAGPVVVRFVNDWRNPTD